MKSCSWKHGQKGLTELTVAHRCRVRRLLIGPNVGRQGRCARSLPPSVFPAAFVTAPHLSTLDQRDKRSEVVTSLCLVDCAGTLGNTATCRRREKNPIRRSPQERWTTDWNKSHNTNRHLLLWVYRVAWHRSSSPVPHSLVWPEIRHIHPIGEKWFESFPVGDDARCAEFWLSVLGRPGDWKVYDRR